GKSVTDPPRKVVVPVDDRHVCQYLRYQRAVVVSRTGRRRAIRQDEEKDPGSQGREEVSIQRLHSSPAVDLRENWVTKGQHGFRPLPQIRSPVADTIVELRSRWLLHCTKIRPTVSWTRK